MWLVCRFRRLCLICALGTFSWVWTAGLIVTDIRAAEPPDPPGPRFKDLVPLDNAAGCLVGASINSGDLGTAAEVNLQRDPKLVTAGNEFKPTGVHPEPGVWRWKKADQMSAYCAERGYLMRLHAPLSPQCSAWVEEDDRTSEELSQNLEEYATAVYQRYNGQPHVRWLDVVNETVTDQWVMEGAQGLVHKHSLFRQITQPALIVRSPHGAGGGQRIALPAEILDLLPTALELAGAATGQAPHGVCLRPLFNGGRIDRPYVFAEIENWIVVSDGRFRLIRSVGNEPPLLFDDVVDPENLTNLAAQHPEQVQALGAAIDAWLQRTGPRLPAKSM